MSEALTPDPALKIAQLGNPILRQVAQPIEQIQDDRLQALIDQLLSLLSDSNGVGIAAPQVAASCRLLIVASRPNARYPNAPLMSPTVMINPQIVGQSSTVVKDWEGCLSVPGIRGLIPRYQEIEVEYLDRSGQLTRQQLSGFVARIFQHEFDHLNGLVFLDRLESLQEIITDQEYLSRIVGIQPA
ncbi:MAG: peptide deformylase [Pegethrix bostrychoides GSE-TBD4-15B]|jgi:peptide deformylase|uniref:Peptide deformylase n=1 Tax=Pegethrix bostrychoides GSE-TBD4-15B TaxID=2839662 RepID=A0A951P949_9CYAN|nr:peptide deformylase [Pegethrix bostrychoides GSE-TBD4-15B]